MTQLADRSVLITGASSGIGAYLAHEIVRRGGRVGLTARREDRLQELADEIRESGGRASWAAADVKDTVAVEKALDQLAAELEGVDVVIANAGYGVPEPPHRFAPGVAEAMYDVNLFGMLRMIDWALPRFLEQEGGHIVGIASVASYLGIPNSPSYCGSKAAMRIHLQSLRCSLAGRGIAVTTICPGFVESELTAPAKFRMPFLWKTDRAASYIADAIEKRRGEVIFPWQMRLLTVFGKRLMPLALLEHLLKRSVPKPKPRS